jgi:peptidyl-prolyl cis-trans isomerase C
VKRSAYAEGLQAFVSFFKESRVRRVVPLLLVVTLAACSRSTPETSKTATSSAAPATASGLGNGAATPAAQTAPPESAKPVPAQLPEVLARVNGEAISKSDFEDAIRTAEQQAGTPVPPDQRDRVYRQILDQMIGYKLLTQESKARKVNIPDADVEARIISLKQQFPTEDAFKQALAQRHMTVEQIKADARQNLAISKLVDDEIAPKVAVKAEDVQSFYQQNPQNFKESEKVHASHILISAPKTADAATRDKARAKAEAILKDVQSGKDFATLAKQNSEDPGSAANGGDLGFFQQGQMVPQFNEVAFSLKPGAVSKVVETDFGYHIIKVIEKQPGRTVPLDEATPRIEQYLEAQNREKQTASFVNGLRAKGKVEVFI